MERAQSVLVRGRVYVGGGLTDKSHNAYQVFRLMSGRDGWDILPPCPVRWFALGQFQGHLITVGGKSREGDITGEVYRYNEESLEWRKYLQPMPTARCFLSIVTTDSAIIACGGEISLKKNCASVEVYVLEADQWRPAVVLPIGCNIMTSIIIADTCYLLGGHDSSFTATKTVLYASVTTLIEKATSQGVVKKIRRGFKHVWKTLPDTPLKYSSVASLGGCLLAIGGCYDLNRNSPVVHTFHSQANSWVRMTSISDLPAAVSSVTAIGLPDGTMLVCGGRDDNGKRIKSVYMGSITV